MYIFEQPDRIYLCLSYELPKGWKPIVCIVRMTPDTVACVIDSCKRSLSAADEILFISSWYVSLYSYKKGPSEGNWYYFILNITL